MAKRRPVPPTQIKSALDQAGATPHQADGAVFARIRDLVLLFSLGSYIFGFLLFAIYATEHGLGFTRLFDSQYFVGGLFPMILTFLGAYATSFNDRALQRALVRYAKSMRFMGRALFALLFLFMIVAAVLVDELVGAIGAETLVLSLSIAACLASVSGITMISSLALSNYERGSKDDRFVRSSKGRSFLFATTVLVAIGGTYIYYDGIYKYIPQEFGGVKSKCHQIVLDQRTDFALVAALSESTIKQLELRNLHFLRFGRNTYAALERAEAALRKAGDGPGPINVDILVAANDRLVVRPFAIDRIGGDEWPHLSIAHPTTDTVEISRSLVQAIMPCALRGTVIKYRIWDQKTQTMQRK